MLLNGHCHIEMIIVSLSLSNLFLPNSNLFPLNLQRQQRSKNQLLYTNERQMQEYITRYVFFCVQQANGWLHTIGLDVDPEYLEFF